MDKPKLNLPWQVTYEPGGGYDGLWSAYAVEDSEQCDVFRIENDDHQTHDEFPEGRALAEYIVELVNAGLSV